MARSKHRAKARLATRIDAVLADWLRTVAVREGWTVTQATEWALHGARHLEHRLGRRLGALLAEERAGGEGVFVAVGRCLAPLTAPATAEPRRARARKT